MTSPGTIQILSEDLLQSVRVRAEQSHRGRSNHNFHHLSEVYQRFLNSFTKGSYVQPHRHLHPPKPETFVALRGDMGFLIFDDSGKLTEFHRLSPQGPVYGIDIPPGVWHSVICLTETAICFEGKSGPYDPTLDKEFHSAFPPEGEESCAQQMKEWEAIFEA